MNQLHKIGVISFEDNPHTLGPRTAPIKLLEYVDFQCPHCLSASFLVKQILNVYGSNIHYIFRHFPISRIHGLARFCALAVEAAGAQGEFWRMHDWIFQSQNILSKNTIFQIAKMIGLDEEKFKHDLESERVKDPIDHDTQLANNAGVKETPTFYINQKLYKGNLDFRSLSQVIEEQLDMLKHIAA